jgi:hypothetical protein
MRLSGVLPLGAVHNGKRQDLGQPRLRRCFRDAGTCGVRLGREEPKLARPPACAGVTSEGSASPTLHSVMPAKAGIHASQPRGIHSPLRPPRALLPLLPGKRGTRSSGVLPLGAVHNGKRQDLGQPRLRRCFRDAVMCVGRLKRQEPILAWTPACAGVTSEGSAGPTLHSVMPAKAGIHASQPRGIHSPLRPPRASRLLLPGKRGTRLSGSCRSGLCTTANSKIPDSRACGAASGTQGCVLAGLSGKNRYWRGPPPARG